MIFGKHINRYYLRHFPLLLLGVLALVAVDYLQLMHSGKKTENRVQEVSEVTRSLKIMAKELNIPVICLSFCLLWDK